MAYQQHPVMQPSAIHQMQRSMTQRIAKDNLVQIHLITEL